MLYKTLKRYEKWAYMEEADIFIEISMRERVSLYGLEFSLLKPNGYVLVDKNSYLNPFMGEENETENPISTTKFVEKLKL